MTDNTVIKTITAERQTEGRCRQPCKVDSVTLPQQYSKKRSLPVPSSWWF